MIADPPNGLRLVRADGTFSEEGWLWLYTLIVYIRALEARIEALEP